jgi:hypothetical protein
VAKRIYAKNKLILAAAINLSRPALRRLFLRSDYPRDVNGKGYNIEQWQRYANENISTWNRRDPSRSNGNGTGPNARDAAFINKQNIEAEKAQFDLEVKRGRYELKTLIKEQVLTHVGTLFRELDKAFKHELPPRVQGLSAGEIAKLNGRRLDDLRERLVKNFEGTNGTELA